MEIIRCSCQDGVPLEEEFSSQDRVLTDADSMKKLLPFLHDSKFEEPVYALTSVDRVCLLSQDDYSSPWWIIITPLEEEQYKIECQIPVELRPWRQARIDSEVSSASRASNVILRALKYCRGWDRSIGGESIGLAELIAEQMAGFRVKGAADACRAAQMDWKNESRIDGQRGSKVVVTLLFHTGDGEVLGYRHDCPCSESRWGLLNEGEDCIGEKWFWSLEDAFYRSLAWPDGPPDDEQTHFWKESRKNR